MPNLDDILSKLKAVEGNVPAQAAITAEFAVSVQPTPIRDRLHEALDAAAVLRWFDPRLLAHMLGIDEKDATERFDALATLPFIERFPLAEARNVHDATRLGWRRKLMVDHSEIFRTLSARAAAWFESGISPSERIEWIYHLLSADPIRGADALEAIDYAWTGNIRPENSQAMALAIRELETNDFVAGEALVEVMLCTISARSSRGETALLEQEVQTVLRLARNSGQGSRLARATCLYGDVYESQGKLDKAAVAFAEYLAISRGLANSDLTNVNWQHEVAVACSRLGGVFEAQNNIEAAKAAFAEDLAISLRLVELDSDNACWQRNLAAAYNRTGNIMLTEEDLEAAATAFAKDLAISRRLAESDPANTSWQRDLVMTCNRVGELLQGQTRLEEAGAIFEESLTLSRQLTAIDPTNADWQRGLAVAYNKMGGLLCEQGKLEEAESIFSEYLTISRRLAETYPTNAVWKRGLAVALFRAANVASSLGNYQKHVAYLQESKRLFEALVLIAPEQRAWQEDHETVSQALDVAESSEKA